MRRRYNCLINLYYSFNNEMYREGPEFFNVTCKSFKFKLNPSKEDKKLSYCALLKKYRESALALAAYKQYM